MTDLDTGRMLDAVAAYISDYMVMTQEQVTAATLWAAHTHVLDAFETTPFLTVTSPTKRCGKTRLLDVLELVVARPWRVITPSEAVLFRKIEKVTPTLLLDETDAIFNSKNGDTEPLRALLNAGNRRGTCVPRCVGPTQALVDFSVYCAKGLAGIGELPDTITDRAIVIRLARKRRDEPAVRFRHREALEAAEPLHMALSSWAQDAVDQLAAARPDVPRVLNERAEEAWEPLLAIADMAGGDWPERARVAAVSLAAPDGRDEENLGTWLLRDVAAVFIANNTDKLSSKELAAGLCAIEESPWGDIRGKPLDERGLARRLKRFGIRPRTIRLDDGMTAKGYHLDELEDVLCRYLDDFERHTVTTLYSSQKQADFDRHTEGEEMARKPAWTNDCDGVTDKNASEAAQSVNGTPVLGDEMFPVLIADAARDGHITGREFEQRYALHQKVVAGE